MKLALLNSTELMTGSELPAEFKLETSPSYPIFMMGRGHFNTITIPHSSVSRSHLAVVVDNPNEGLRLRDLGSQNGTLVNSERLVPYRWVKVKAGDTLQLGGVLLEVQPSGPFLLNRPPAVPIPAQPPTLPLEWREAVGLWEAALAAESPAALADKPNFWRPGWVRWYDLARLWLSSRWIFWLYLALITLAEWLTAVVNLQAGLSLHTLLLITLLLHGAIGPDEKRRQFALALVLAPLTRLLSISLPLASFSQLLWYPLVSVPLLLSVWLIVGQNRLSWASLGLRRGNNLRLQVLLVGGGFGLGALEYNILRPRPLLNELSWQSIILPALSLIIFTGFNEEIIFRGLMQHLGWPVFGFGSLLYISLLFAALHIGYLSLLDLGFVFLVGLSFSLIVHWGSSLLGVCLMHGLTNVTMFLLMPYLEQNPADPLGLIAPSLIWGGSIVSLVAFGWLGWQYYSGKNQNSFGKF